MSITQITHNDLDGYGASAIVANVLAVGRVEHVVRYADVVPVLEAEFARLSEAKGAETVLVTDIAVEPGCAALLARFAKGNMARAEPHRILVIDHHASSVGCLEGAGFAWDASASPPRWIAPGGEGRVEAIVDTGRSATRLCADLAPFLRELGERSEPAMTPKVAEALAEAVDAVDLWRRDRPAFDAGEAINELFWEVVLTYVPPGHEMHDAFVNNVLAGAALQVALGLGAHVIEEAGPALRRDAVDMLLEAAGLEETGRQRKMTTRMRASRLLARSDRLFAEPFPGQRIKVAHGLDAGIMQRTSDFMLDEGVADVVVNVMRGGAMSFRSRNGEAMELAARFGGGGHPNAAGARLPSPAVFSLDEAVRMMRDVVEAPVASPGP